MWHARRRRTDQVQPRFGPVEDGPVGELVAATMALDRAGKDFARETGYRAGLEWALELVQGEPELADAVRAELRRVAWISGDGVGPVHDRRDQYALAAERVVQAFGAVGAGETFASLAEQDVPGPPDLPAGFRSFGAHVPMAG